MRREFKLPDVGEGLTEAEIVRWHVKPGDDVKVNQIIVEIETAKAVVELPCPFDGVVTDLLAQEGQTVDVGVAIIAVDDGADGPAGPAAAPGRAAEDLVPSPPAEGAVEPGVHGSPAPKEERQPVLVGYGVKTGATKRRPRKQPAAEPAAPAVSETPVAAAPRQAPERVTETPARPPVPSLSPQRAAVLAKPPVRKLAKDLGIDLAALTGTGPHGTITREDVRAAATAPAEVPTGVTAGVTAGGPREERIPIKGVRRATAQAMVASAFTAPHVTEFLQLDVTETVDAVRRLRELPDFAGVKVSPLLLVAKALLVAARRHPMINSSWDDHAQEIVVKHYVNLGIAAATPRGLVVPNVKDAHALSLPGLAAALGELTETARAGRTQPADMAGGTITITNVGVFGVDTGTPILNPGEAAILAVGQIRDLPWVVDGQVVPRKVCTLALSFDHRIVDGELGSRVLRAVGDMLEDPLRMLVWS
ncbi:dihydrolipoamide acetyltransferase component of pyruvate dehydrogenase complex [Microtetraspora sp. NBRC 13810]|uniref:dihydrolipoamide acetyltransferase family protein n=1 Tax=Microtetraspora sp. NBRC 13810 TaxID=3030990 RepID=UPI0024A31A68|nr:dihydrolipoamide acetyltransferase family protein [Microtetraspora sp. NBRC 13810]GLW12610.1 dihydrolipoamide acetyltransferase component of pyruvate dehydrogenase complex [Microtetraspora sp. NBRC 13810]